MQTAAPVLARPLPAPPGAAPAGPGALRQNGRMEATSQTHRPGAHGSGLQRVAGSYQALRTSLLSYLRKHTGDAQVAEDLLHDVVLKALTESRDTARAPRNLTGWLYAVARNAAMDHHRRQRPTEELPEELPADEADEEEAALAELANCLRPMAERLPDTYRDTLIAAEFDGLALAEVARRQGLSLSAVKSRTSRGRRLLQEALMRCCRVELSNAGLVLDDDPRKAAGCGHDGAPRCGTGARRA